MVQFLVESLRGTILSQREDRILPMGDILKDGQSTLQEKTNFFDMKKRQKCVVFYPRAMDVQISGRYSYTKT